MKSSHDKPLKILVLLGTAYFPPFLDELGEMSRAGTSPRLWLFNISGNLTLLDQRFLTGPPKLLLTTYRILPIWAAQALEALRVKRHYDVVFAWGAEPVALSYALLLKLTGSKVPLVALFSWISQPKKAWFIRLVQSHITKLVLPPLTQHEFAIRQLGISAQKAVEIPWSVDEEFWQEPAGIEPDMISAVGREMRDFDTLVEALEGTGIPCHIAAPAIRGKDDQWRRTLGESGDRAELPGNVTVGSKNPVQLRELYARSRFVVLPLHPSDTDNGITCLLEAWSMSRPVICSQITGQRDAIEHGQTGLYVPAEDAAALREAIVDLWNQPGAATQMGREGRRAVEKNRRLDRFAQDISGILRDAVASATR